MAKEPRRLTLRFSRNAERSLIRIWLWNAWKYGRGHADGYKDFLLNGTLALETAYESGRPVPTHSSFRYVTLRRRWRGHGHVVVYEPRQAEVYVIDYFHTAQDWQSKVRKEKHRHDDNTDI